MKNALIVFEMFMLQMMITILFHDMYSYYNIIIFVILFSFVIEHKNKGANDKQLAKYSK